MKNVLKLLLGGLLLISFTGCDKNEHTDGFGSLELIFKARYASQDLIVGKTYDYFGLGSIKFTKSDFFMSHLTLGTSENLQLLKDVSYVTLLEHNIDSVSAAEGLSMKFDGIKTGDYTELGMTIGLSPAQNATTPSSYSSSHPMADGGRYWAGWNSYIFSKTEGVFNDGVSNSNFTYHSGFDDAARNIIKTMDIHIHSNKTTRVVIYIDHKMLFDEGGAALNIKATPQIHNKSDLMTKFMDRFTNAITVEK